tara:strand:- start:471 stop:695 length:225 start_codon:yes stop_codon:yes gene_type:complete
MQFPRGKYKGRLISDIERSDPGYIRWCKENTPWMLKISKPKGNSEEQEFKKDYQQQSQLQEYLRNNPGSWETAF